jgi:O-antigen/teichoic acid export membrane protein
MGIAGLAWAQLVQHGLTILIAWVIARQRVNITAIVPLGFSLSTFREMFRFSVNAQVANIANGLFEPLTKILIGHYGGMRVLGIYELAFKTLWLPRTAIIGGVSAMMPALTTLLKFEPDKVWALYQKSAYKSTLAVVATSVCAIMASPFISLLWLGSVDTDYSIYMVILSLGIIINAWGASAYNLGVITGKMKNNIKVNLFVLLLLMLSVPMFSLFNLRPELLIVISALCLALGGYGIRKLNENLLQTIIGVK